MCDVFAMAQQPALEITAQVLREKIGLSQGYASDLANGKRRPSLKLAVRIQREIGIPITHWDAAA